MVTAQMKKSHFMIQPLYATGGLISDFFSLWLKSPKKGKRVPNHSLEHKLST